MRCLDENGSGETTLMCGVIEGDLLRISLVSDGGLIIVGRDGRIKIPKDQQGKDIDWLDNENAFETQGHLGFR